MSRVPVKARHHKGDKVTFLEVDVSSRDLVVNYSLSRVERDGWVQPQSLMDHHVQVREALDS